MLDGSKCRTWSFVRFHCSNSPASESPDLMLVLTGPEGCGKEVLVRRLCQEFGEYFGVGICHTTRKPYIGEENGIDYHFVSEEDFQSLVHMGKFIQTMQYNGHMFGLTREAIEEVVEDGLVCCRLIFFQGVLSLKKTYFEPRYILLIPTQMEKFISHLKSLKLHPPAQIDFCGLYEGSSENYNKKKDAETRSKRRKKDSKKGIQFFLT
uniref:Guanylate kinase-like domain-containing protein n=1 Tax=Cyprinodon variegatus TaxID=28743 RepID=A0A3Q2G5Z3_CYPVA